MKHAFMQREIFEILHDVNLVTLQRTCRRARAHKYIYILVELRCFRNSVECPRKGGTCTHVYMNSIR